MSLNYYFDPQSHVVYVIGQGEVSIDERIRFFQQMLPDPALPKDASVLVDINKITNTPTEPDVRIIAMLVGWVLVRFSGRIAIVNAAVGHMMIAHMIAMSGDDGHDRVRVFSCQDYAIAWIQG